MCIPSRIDIFARALSTDPENTVLKGAALIVVPDRVYPDSTELASSDASSDDGITATPNRQHFETCRPFLEAGIWLICDKPPVNRNDEARTVIAFADHTDTFCAVTYTCTGYPMVCVAREHIHASEAGAVRFLHLEYLLEWLAVDQPEPGNGLLWCSLASQWRTTWRSLIPGLRVCGNSVGTNLVSGNTNGVAIVIAKRAAEHIRHGWPQVAKLPV